MSQKGSSMASDNPEFKYKKALLEIQKIHNANKQLKRQSEEMKMDYERQIADFSESLSQMEKECMSLKDDKAEIEKYYEELQMSHSDLQDSNNNLKRQVKYLNDALNDHSEQLRMIDALKSENGLSTLISSYEDRQFSYRKDTNRLEEMNKSLKANFQTLDNDLAEERRQKFKFEDLNNNLKMEIAKYRELNNFLISKNENIVTTLASKNTEGKEKFKEAESMLLELRNQLEMVKSSRIEQQTSNKSSAVTEKYEEILHQKGKLQVQLNKLREKIGQYEYRHQKSFETEEKMQRAELRAEQLQEECNMLKGRLILLETKDAMDSEMEFSDLKELQERVMNTHNDPLISIKNSSDSSHFQLMKSYIIDLKEKLSKAVVAKKEYEKKYRSLKEKLTDKAEKSINFEEQNKLLKGKIEGYERLTERLQFELQKSIQSHEEEVCKMKSVTNSIITKKTDQVKVANAYVRAQLDLELDKFQKTEKGLRQELETVRLELSTEKIKNADLQDKYNQASQFLAVYEQKFNDMTMNNQEFEDDNEVLHENATKYEQLYREQRSKNEVLLGQKSTLTNKLTQVSDQLERKSISEEQIRNKFDMVEGQAKKNKIDLMQARAELDSLQNIIKTSKKQFDDKSRVAMMDISKNDTGYYNQIEKNFKQEREKNRQLEAQMQALKIRVERTSMISQKIPQLEDQVSQRNDELSDYKRKAILTEKQISVHEAEMRQIRSEFDLLRKENSALKAKVLESGQELRRSYETKDIQAKKTLQKINEELTSALSELREERRLNSRLQTDIQNSRTEIQRLTTTVEQCKTKELHLFEEVGQLKNAYEGLNDENERMRSEGKFKDSRAQNLSNQIAGAQERIFKMTQETSEVKIKKEELENEISELKRDILGLKVYLNEAETFANTKAASGNWEEQRNRDNISNLVQKVKKIQKKAEYNAQTFDYRPSTYVANAPDYLKGYHEPLFNNYAGSYKPLDLVIDSPVVSARDSLNNKFSSGLAFKMVGEYN